MRITGLTVQSPDWGASMRYRFAQYANDLHAANIKLDVIPFASYLLRRTIYERYSALIKCAGILESFLRWLPKLRTETDIIFIQRESLPFGVPVIEAFLSRYKPLIYDYDDAIWIITNSRSNGSIVKWIRPQSKVRHLIEMSKLVIAGNPFLAKYAQQYHSWVEVIPTVVNTDEFTPTRFLPENRIPTIGWIGSHSTTRYLEQVIPILEDIAKIRHFRLYLVGADRQFYIDGIDCINKTWNQVREIEDFQHLDIGLYPLQNTLWEQGKCAFKAIQYGAVGIPTVCSPVGFNTEIIVNGETGFYAESPQEWRDHLLYLIDHPEKRQLLGKMARQRVSSSFSTATYSKYFIQYIQQVAYE